MDSSPKIEKRSFLARIDYLGQLWAKHAEVLILMGCLLVPLKLTFVYFCFGPAIVGWLCLNRQNLKTKAKEYEWFLYPWGLFVLSLCVSSLFGFQPSKSFRDIHSLLFYPIVIFAIADSFHGVRALLPLFALVTSQSLAGIHTILDGASAYTLPRFFLGAVTEAGQLALVAPLVCGLAVTLHRFSKRRMGMYEQIQRAARVALIAATLCVGAFSAQLFSLSQASSISITLILILVLIVFHKNKPVIPLSIDALTQKSPANFFPLANRFLEAVFLPIILAALVVNLKRGPWAGVIAAFGIFTLIYSRRLVIPLLLAVTLIVGIAEPVRTRLLQSWSDFFIAGGRSAIWNVGLDLCERFPLGIGFRNSKFLHFYSAEIPAELTHFHNNILNIFVETGPLTLILFLIWIFSILRFAFQAKCSPALAPTAKGIGCALVAWQVAGLVEYNFGDSEVVFVVYILLGSLAGLQKLPRVDKGAAGEISVR